MADSKTSFAFGWYEGTKWDEYDVPIDRPCCIVSRSSDASVKASVEKTKEGYFVVDADGLNPGVYKHRNCLLEII